MLGNMEDAQDAAQEVFLRLHRHIRSLDPDRDAGAWLRRTTMNACFDQLRRRKPSAELAFEPPVAPSQHDALELEERKRMVAAALLQLPEKERAAVVLRDIEGLETAEVARILGSSETTVRSQVSMAKAHLRAILENRR